MVETGFYGYGTAPARNYIFLRPRRGPACLFGSRAADRTGPLSDYDFGVCSQSYSPALRDELQHELATLIGTPKIDVVFLQQAPIELAYAIIAEGILLYQSDTATRVDVEANILNRYCDYLPVLKAQRQEIRDGRDHEPGTERYIAALRRTERTLAALRTAENKDE